MVNSDIKIIPSVCRSCHGGCSVFLHVKNNRLLRVKPDPKSPFNLGQMCIKGLCAPQVVHHPNRLTHPLKRTGRRGEMTWERLDWYTALDEIAGRIDSIRSESGPEAIAVGQGTGRHHFMHTVRFANSLGTPNWYEPGMANCLLPRINVSQFTYGGYVTADYYGSVKPRTILFWGHNPMVSAPDGELPYPAKQALKQGSFGIAIDPRRSETAKRCQMWIPIRPGTDAALALAMIHVIIYDRYYDAEFVENQTTGFDLLKEHVLDCTPKWAENITGIPEQDIIRVAKQYALEKPSVIEWGVALEHTPNSLQTVRAVAVLRGLTGNLDIPGGDILGMNIIPPYPILRELLPKGAVTKRIGAEQFKLLGGFRSPLQSAHIPGVLDAMRGKGPYRIQALLNFGSNPLVSIAGSRDVHEALLSLDLLVAADLFMTPTTALADYVLPAAYWPEVDQLVELPFIAENAVLAQQKAVQIGECRQDEEILIDLARRLNLPKSDQSLMDIFNERLASIGTDFESLKMKQRIYPQHTYRKYEVNGFHTPSRKVELYSKTLKRMGYDPLPSYREPPESPVSTPEIAQTYPLILITGSRRLEFFLSEHRQVDRLRKKRPFPQVEINPEIAAAYNIEQDDWVLIQTVRGEIRMKANVTTDILQNVVNADHGWWFPERSGPDFGVWESNVNLLTNNGPPYDPAFGTYQLRALLCRIQKYIPDIHKP